MQNNIFKNYLFEKTFKNHRELLQIKFPNLKNSKLNTFLSLYKYINKCPEKFYSEEVFEIYLKFLIQEEKNSLNRLKSLFNDNLYRINIAFILLNVVNNYSWHESLSNQDEFDKMLYFNEKILPTYLKTLEGIYFPYVYFLAYISRINRNISIEGLKIYNCIDDLSKISSYKFICNAYDNIIRNGIAHGGITYSQHDIFFKDIKGNIKEKSYDEFLFLLDNFIDICNAFTLATKIFLLLNIEKSFPIPEQFMIDEIQAKTESPWWKIDGCLKSKIINNKDQLLIYTRTNSSDYSKIQYFSFMTAILCEQLIPGFDRYFISIYSKIAYRGWAAFDGKKIRKIRQKRNKSIEDYKDVLIDNLLFYKPKYKFPKFIYKINTLYHSFRIHISSAFRNLPLSLNVLYFDTRVAKIHRNKLSIVLNGSIIVYNNKNTLELIKKYKKKIIKKSLKFAKKKSNKILNILPLGFARINLFHKNFRIRRLNNYGLGPDLIGTIQYSRIKRIKSPDIYNSTIEEIGLYRFAWNNSYLAKNDLT